MAVSIAVSMAVGVAIGVAIGVAVGIERVHSGSCTRLMENFNGLVGVMD